MTLRRRLTTLAVFVLLSFALIGWVAQAQDAPTPVVMGSSTVGAVSAAAPVARYTVTSESSALVTVQVLTIGTGFFPHLRVTDPSGTVLVDLANGGQGNVSVDTQFNALGAYLIEVSGEQGSSGQFVLVLNTVEPGETMPVDLLPGQAVEATAVDGAPPLRYHVNGAGLAGQLVTIKGTLPEVGPTYSIFDETTGLMIASSDGSLLGGMHILSGANVVYRIEVSSGDGRGDVPFSICLGCASAESSTQMVPATQVAATMTPTEPPVCNVVPSITKGAVNVRRAPTTTAGFVGALKAGQSFPALGQTSDNGGWYKFVLPNGAVGWVSATFAHLEGDCAALGFTVSASTAPG